MKFAWSDGWNLGDLCTEVAAEDDYTLATEEKTPLVSCVFSAASKALTLGLEVGDVMLVSNVGGTNAVTVKAIEGDTGTSLAAGKVAICIGAAAANASKIYVLN